MHHHLTLILIYLNSILKEGEEQDPQLICV
jgi:hypothetical protein